MMARRHGTHAERTTRLDGVLAAVRGAFAAMRDGFEAIRHALASRGASPLRIVACRALYGGGALYVADVDGRRLVFIAGQHTACLLARYETPHPEGTRLPARLKAHTEC